METYEKLKQEAGDDEPILFIDGVHPTQGTKLAYGWMPAGKKAHVVETTGSRPRLNIMGALNLNDIGSTVIRDQQPEYLSVLYRHPGSVSSNAESAYYP